MSNQLLTSNSTSRSPAAQNPAISVQDNRMMALIDKYPEVIATDGANGTNKDRRVLQFVMATCDDLIKRPAALGVLPGETIEAVGFLYKAIHFLVKCKLGVGRLAGTMALISDQAPGTVRVHRMLSGMKQESAFGGVAFATLVVRSDVAVVGCRKLVACTQIVGLFTCSSLHVCVFW